LIEESLIAILGEIGKRISVHENKIRRKLNLSEAEFKGILCMDDGEKITCQEFSKRMDLSISRGSRVIDRLVAKKYIKRVDCNVDRRCKNIWFTEKGKKIRHMIAEEILSVEDVLTSGYPAAKLMLLKGDMKRLCRKL
jgi:DNA-binding MarR family transcriptional regulator